MSHVSEFLDCAIPRGNIQALKEAVSRFCPTLEFVEGQQHYRSWKDDHNGSLVGDWPVPAGLTAKQWTEQVGNNAEHVIRMKAGQARAKTAYEIGVVPYQVTRDAAGKVLSKRPSAEGNEFALLCDFWAQGNGILEEPGVGKAHRSDDSGNLGGMTAFGDLYQHYQMCLTALAAEQVGDVAVFSEENGVPIAHVYKPDEQHLVQRV